MARRSGNAPSRGGEGAQVNGIVFTVPHDRVLAEKRLLRWSSAAAAGVAPYVSTDHALGGALATDV